MTFVVIYQNYDWLDRTGVKPCVGSHCMVGWMKAPFNNEEFIVSTLVTGEATFFIYFSSSKAAKVNISMTFFVSCYCFVVSST